MKILVSEDGFILSPWAKKRYTLVIEFFFVVEPNLNFREERRKWYRVPIQSKAVGERGISSALS